MRGRVVRWVGTGNVAKQTQCNQYLDYKAGSQRGLANIRGRGRGVCAPAGGGLCTCASVGGTCAPA